MSQTETIPKGKSEETPNQAAAVKENVAPKDKSTSQRLFSDMADKPEIAGIKNLFPKDQETVKKPEQPVKEEPKPEAKKEEKKYLKLEDFKDTLLKLKVDGVEEEASLEDVVRRVQFDTHLTKKSQRLSEEEKRVKARVQELEERERLLTELLAQSKPNEKGEEPSESIVADDPEIKRLKEEQRKLQETVNALHAQAKPMMLQAALERTANQVKEELGLDDFPKYHDKIRDYLKALPEGVGLSKDNEAGWVEAYKDIKLREFMEGAKNRQTKPEIERPAPKLVPVESGASVNTSNLDDEATKGRELLARAKELTQKGDRHSNQAWEDYFSYNKRLRETQ